MIKNLDSHCFERHTICSKQHVPESVLMNEINDIRQFHHDVIISCGCSIDVAKILSLVLAEDIQTEEELYPYSENRRERKAIMLIHFHISPFL